MASTIDAAYVIPVVVALTGGIVYLFKYIRDLYKEGREDKITMTEALKDNSAALREHSQTLKELEKVINNRKR